MQNVSNTDLHDVIDPIRNALMFDFNAIFVAKNNPKSSRSLVSNELKNHVPKRGNTVNDGQTVLLMASMRDDIAVE
jgi:hypothetical protein